MVARVGQILFFGLFALDAILPIPGILLVIAAGIAAVGLILGK